MSFFGDLLDKAADWAGDALLDEAGDLLSEDSYYGDDGGDGGGGGDDGGGSSWTDRLSNLLGGSDDDDGDGDGGGSGGGWTDVLGGMVDRLSGGGESGADGEGGSWYDGIVDRVRDYIPDDLRDATDTLFSSEGGASSWAGNLMGRVADELPEGWRSVVSASAGHSFGEDGVDGLIDHSLDRLGVTPAGEDADGPAAPPSSSDNGDEHGDAVGPPAATSGLADDDVVGGPRGVEPDDDLRDDVLDHDDVPPDAGADADALHQPADPTFPDDDVQSAVPEMPDVAPVEEPVDEFQEAIDMADEFDAGLDAVTEGM